MTKSQSKAAQITDTLNVVENLIKMSIPLSFEAPTQRTAFFVLDKAIRAILISCEDDIVVNDTDMSFSDYNALMDRIDNLRKQ